MLPALKTPRKALAIDAASISLERLPKGLRLLVNGLGEALAYKLIQVRGGTQLGVPKTLIFDHPLHHELGSALYAELVAKRGGEVLEVPKDDAIVMQHRHRRVRELRAAGHSRDAVARQTGYSWRQVVNIWNAGEEDRAFNQGDLFAALPSSKAAHKARPPQVKAPIEAQHVWSAHDPFGMARRNAAQAKAERASE